MAKKNLGGAEVKTKKPVLYYANKDKVQRAQKLVDAKEFKTLKAAYESLGGLFAEGHGYMPV
jgi:hypothetical protein